MAADRAYETQAAVVRIMKRVKSISHVLLVSEVVGATKSRGVLEGGEIKKNIERFVTVLFAPFFLRGMEVADWGDNTG